MKRPLTFITEEKLSRITDPWISAVFLSPAMIALYAFLLDWPEDETFDISSFSIKNGLGISNISSVSLLGSDESISFSKTQDGIQIKLPQDKPCEYAFCFKFELI